MQLHHDIGQPSFVCPGMPVRMCRCLRACMRPCACSRVRVRICLSIYVLHAGIAQLLIEAGANAAETDLSARTDALLLVLLSQ